jgi:hypothetical protein
MVVQDVINAVSNDMRQVLSNASPDTAILTPWVDRTQKDVLHTSLFNFLLRDITTITTAQNTSLYPLVDTSNNPLPIRRITSVYDRTFDRVLLPYDNLAFPAPKSDQTTPGPMQMPDAMLDAATMLQWPSYYLRQGQSNLHLFPAPQKAAFVGSYEVYYEMFAPDLALVTDTLLVPDDGIDLVVAGTNMLASQYLKNPEETANWTQVYQSMKAGAFKG